MILTPGPDLPRGGQAGAMPLLGERDRLAAIDSINYGKTHQTDAQGRIVFPALIPGASYRVAFRDRARPAVRKEFRVKPGETLDLGDIPIEKPLAQ